MKASEIRIGNLIASSGNKEDIETWVIGEVISISSLDSEFEQIEVETAESIEWFFKDNYFGIPLTEEWLLKFGFEREYELRKTVYYMNNYSIILWVYKNGRIDLRIGGIDFKDKDVRFKKYQYVHQLQNLYFALTNTELEIRK